MARTSIKVERGKQSGSQASAIDSFDGPQEVVVAFRAGERRFVRCEVNAQSVRSGFGLVHRRRELDFNRP